MSEIIKQNTLEGFSASLAEVAETAEIPSIVIKHQYPTRTIAEKINAIGSGWQEIRQSIVTNLPRNRIYSVREVWVAYSTSMAGFVDGNPFVATTFTGIVDSRWSQDERRAIAQTVTGNQDAGGKRLNVGERSGIDISEYGWEPGSVGPFPIKEITNVVCRRFFSDEELLDVPDSSLVVVNFALTPDTSMYVTEPNARRLIKAFGNLVGNKPDFVSLGPYSENESMIFPSKPIFI